MARIGLVEQRPRSRWGEEPDADDPEARIRILNSDLDGLRIGAQKNRLRGHDDRWVAFEMLPSPKACPAQQCQNREPQQPSRRQSDSPIPVSVQVSAFVDRDRHTSSPVSLNLTEFSERGQPPRRFRVDKALCMGAVGFRGVFRGVSHRHDTPEANRPSSPR